MSTSTKNPIKRYIGRYWKSLQDGQWYFNLTARNGEPVVSSTEGYKRERSLLKTLNGLEPVTYRVEKLDPR